MSTRSSTKGPRARTLTLRIRTQPKKIIEVEGLAAAVARHLQGERRRAIVLGMPWLAAPIPAHRLAGAVTRQHGAPWRTCRLPARDLASALPSQLGRGCGKVAIPTVLRAIEHELRRTSVLKSSPPR